MINPTTSTSTALKTQNKGLFLEYGDFGAVGVEVKRARKSLSMSVTAAARFGAFYKQHKKNIYI